VQRDGDGEAEALSPSQLVPGGGQMLPESLRQTMERALVHDFSSVRIHTDGSRAQAMGAEAYTVGSDIVFKPGNDDFSSPEAQKRLAHELTHVKQQSAGRVAGSDLGNGVAMSDRSDSFEREARDAADIAMGGGAISTGASFGPAAASAPAAAMTVQRDDDGSGKSPADLLKDKLKDKAKDILKEGGKDAAGKPLERLGKVAGPAGEATSGLIGVARADNAADRALAAEDGFKGTVGAIGKSLGGDAGKKVATYGAEKAIDLKRQAFPFQGEVSGAEASDPDFKVNGDLNGDGTTINRNLQGDGVGNINRGDETITPDGTRTTHSTGETVNAGDGAPSANAPVDAATKKYLDEEFAKAKAADDAAAPSQEQGAGE
jgi:hypothetical protein